MAVMPKIPEGVDPAAEKAVRYYLIERYTQVIRDPQKSARGSIPILNFTPDDILSWEVVEELSPIDGRRGKVQLLVQDPYVTNKTFTLKLNWEETDEEVLQRLALLIGHRNATIALPRGMTQFNLMQNAFDPTSAKARVPNSMSPIEFPKVPGTFKVNHNITFNVTLPSPIAKTAKSLPWEMPLTSVAFQCTCSQGFFCEVIRQKINSGALPSEFTDLILHGTNSIEIGLPLFGCVLHRVHIRLVREKNNWSDSESTRFEISKMDHKERWGVKFIHFYDTTDMPDVLGSTLVDLENSIYAESTPLLKDKHADVMNFINGNASIICKNARARPGKLAVHNYGTTRKLQEWHNEIDKGSIEFARRVAAEIHCLLTYGECYWCYKNNDMALILPFV